MSQSTDFALLRPIPMDPQPSWEEDPGEITVPGRFIGCFAGRYRVLRRSASGHPEEDVEEDIHQPPAEGMTPQEIGGTWFWVPRPQATLTLTPITDPGTAGFQERQHRPWPKAGNFATIQTNPNWLDLVQIRPDGTLVYLATQKAKP